MRNFMILHKWLIPIAMLLALGACGEEAEVVKNTTEDPSIPGGLTAASKLGEITFTWNAVPGADSHNLYYAGASGVTTADTVVTGATSPHTFTGLANGTPIYVIVTSVTGGVESSPSVEIGSTSPFDVMTTEPTGYTGTLTADVTQAIKITPTQDIVLTGIRYTHGDDLIIYDGVGNLIYQAAVNVAAPSTAWLYHELPTPLTLSANTDYYVGNYVNGTIQYSDPFPIAAFSFAHGTIDTTQEYWEFGLVFPGLTDPWYYTYINIIYSLP